MKRPRLILALVVAVNLLALAPMLECGYCGDDTLNSLAPGALAEAGRTAWEGFGDALGVWAAHGRFYSLAFYYIFLFSAVRSLWAYRLLQMALVALDLLLFAGLVMSWTGSRKLGLLAALLPAALFQFRVASDPVLAFHGMMEVVFALVAGSLLLLDFHLRTGRRWLLVPSALCYLLGLLTYDITYPFFLLHAALLWCRAPGPGRAGFTAKRLAPFALLAFAVAGVSLFLRARHGVGLPGHSYPGDPYAQPPGLALWPVTWARQTVAALPLTHLALFLRPRALVTTEDLLAQCSAGVVVSALAGLVLARRLLREPDAAAAGGGLGPGPLFLLGGLLTVLPGALMALAPLHQQALRWGTGHVPVYVSYFGVATLLIALGQLVGRLSASHRRWYAGLATAGAVVFAATVAVNAATNRWMVGAVNVTAAHYARSLLQNGMGHGLLSAVPAGSRLVLADRPGFTAPEGYAGFFRQYGRRHLDIAAPGAYPASQPATPVFYLRYGAPAASVGYALLGKCDRLAVTKEAVLAAPAAEALLYVQLPDAHQGLCVAGKWLRGAGAEEGEYFALAERQLRLLNQGRTWRLYAVPFGGRRADLASLTVDLDGGR